MNLLEAFLAGQFGHAERSLRRLVAGITALEST
jgi:hypothetical protein